MKISELKTIDQITREQLKDKEFVKAFMDEWQDAFWYVKQNDVIGGWCIMALPLPPSCGLPEVASFIHKEDAEHIVKLHNEWVMKGTGP